MDGKGREGGRGRGRGREYYKILVTDGLTWWMGCHSGCYFRGIIHYLIYEAFFWGDLITIDVQSLLNGDIQAHIITFSSDVFMLVFKCCV